MNTGSSRDSLMAIRVSPALVIVVLILVAAILVGLYFMVVARPSTAVPVETAALAPGSLLVAGVLAPLATTATPRGSSSRPGTREKAASV